MSDAWLFFKEFVREPGGVGAILPSSPALAASIVAAAELRDGQVIVEFGAGTGPFTRAIRTAVPGARLIAFEPSAPMAAKLRDEMPDLDLVERYAADLPEVLAERDLTRCDRVVSGLPWAVFPEDVQRQTLSAVTQCLSPGGRFVTFQYVHSQVMPQAKRFLALMGETFATVDRSPITWNNVPPAFVFVGTVA